MEDSGIIKLYRGFQHLFQLPEGIEPNVTGLSTLLRLFKQVANPRDFSQFTNIYENNLMVYHRKCLRNGFRHALYGNDKQSAKTCFDILLNAVLIKVSATGNDLAFSTERSVEEGSNSESDEAPVVEQSIKSLKDNKKIVTASSNHYLNSEKHCYRNRDIVSSRGQLSSDSELEYTKKKSARGYPNYLKSKTRVRTESYTSDESDSVSEKVKSKKLESFKKIRRSLSDSNVSIAQEITKKVGKTNYKRKNKAVSDTEESNSDVEIHQTKKHKYSKKCRGNIHLNSSSDSSCEISENNTDSDENLFGNSSSICRNKNSLKSQSQRLKKDPKQVDSRTVDNSGSNLLGKCKDKKKTNDKKRNNKVEKETSEVDATSSTKFIDRLKQLESSILKGSPDPLSKDVKKTSYKQNKATESTSKNLPVKTVNEKKNASNKKVNSTGCKKSANEEKALIDSNSPQAVNKKIPNVQKVTQTTKKKAAVKTLESNKKAKVSPVKLNTKIDSKKPPAKKFQKIKIIKSPKQKTLDNKKVVSKKKVTDSKSKTDSRKKNVVAKAKSPKASSQKSCPKARITKTSAKGQVTKTSSKKDKSEQDKAKEEEKGDNVENKCTEKEDCEVRSCISSEEHYLESEPELGTLSACLNSIKRKEPRQLGSATPPLKMFCIANSDIHSESSDDNSSFTNVPLKLDDKNVVKRMAKANKSKKRKDQPLHAIKKMTATPSALRKIMKLKKKTDVNSDSELDCSSFSDE